MRIGRNPKESVKVEEPKDVVEKKDEKPQATETTGGGTDGGSNTDIGVGVGVQQMNGEGEKAPETNPETQGEGGEGNEDGGDADGTQGSDDDANEGDGGKDTGDGEGGGDADNAPVSDGKGAEELHTPLNEPTKGKRGRPAKK